MINEEYFEISRELEQHHAVFYTMWELGEPVFTSTIDTAGVAFDREGDVLSFQFNPEFWKSRSAYERAFIVSHECLHVILNHGYRVSDTEYFELANRALDVVVNHTLTNRFGFDRTKITGADKFCWVDTVFPGKDLPDDESFEFYMRELIKEEEEQEGGSSKASGPSTVDDHSLFGSSAEELEDVCRELNNHLSDEEKAGLEATIDKHFQDPVQHDEEVTSHKPGTTTGGVWTFAKVDKVKKKKKWETVIKQWSSKYIKPNFKDVEQWARTNRRFTFLNEELMLPTEMEIEEDEVEEGKIEVWFFQDTSGSCAHFKDRFFKAALSLPEDRFEVRMHCFDTEVFLTSLESRRLYGFGGTSFSILEDYVQREMRKTGTKYPEAVFVITDGWGDRIRPAQPEKWYWFLSTECDACIPDACHIFKLSDFE
jgi:predicted metal-dependent peptidase